MTIEQAMILMEQLEPVWLQTLLVVAIMTAIRESELLALHWKHVDFQRETIEVEVMVVDEYSGKPAPFARPGLRSSISHCPGH